MVIRRNSAGTSLSSRWKWIVNATTIKSFPGSKLTLPWKDFCYKLLKLQPIPKIMVICWQKPEQGVYKLNTDGSYDKNNGNAGLGGALRALRDVKGQLMMAFSVNYQYTSHNMEEAKTAWYGGTWCKQHGYNNLVIELDSMVITDMLRNKNAGSFKLNKIIEDTSEVLSNVKFTHCFRKANQPADWLAKKAMNSHDNNIYLSEKELPNGAKGPYI
ncbi:uncharacterized protein LOC132614702 [Lycium barbarum]|uniref:uncharacterized protein LOC132614702 n=1 Tax=Lycium barbarum TaxID=112863 RepID=UPI00293E9D1B|nr:uncharacterized protein LOC132614702 [Lycium barbarum]